MNIDSNLDDKDDDKKQLSSSVAHDEKTKFRSFIIAYNKHYGYLLLRAYKKSKGLHHQLPGGHIDKCELHGHSFEEAAKMAAKRELFEETGLNIKDESRLKYLKLGIKNRVYFQLLLKDEDSLHHTINKQQLTKSLNDKQEFYLKLSVEHNAFQFEKDISKAIEMISQHSGGKNSDALDVYAQKAKHERKRSRSNSNSTSTTYSLSSYSKHMERSKKRDKKHRKKDKKDKKEKKNKMKSDSKKKVILIDDNDKVSTSTLTQ